MYINLLKLPIALFRALRSADARDELCVATLTVAFSWQTLWLEAAHDDIGIVGPAHQVVT